MTNRVQYSYFVIRRPPSFNRSFFVIRIFVKPLDFPFSRPGFADSRRHLSSFGRHRLWATILSVISNSTFGNSLTPNRVHDLVAELCSSQCSRNPVKKRLFAYLQKRRRLSQPGTKAMLDRGRRFGHGTALAKWATKKIEEIQKEISI
jgi:hypothetical protein